MEHVFTKINKNHEIVIMTPLMFVKIEAQRTIFKYVILMFSGGSDSEIYIWDYNKPDNPMTPGTKSLVCFT